MLYLKYWIPLQNFPCAVTDGWRRQSLAAEFSLATAIETASKEPTHRHWHRWHCWHRVVETSWGAPQSPSLRLRERKLRNAANVTLNDARKTTLQGQLQDLNATKEAEMLQFQEVEMAAQSLQQEMAKMVDEHEALTRQRYELWARQKELADETLRLQAVLADLDSDAQVKNDQPESEGNRSLAKTAERLKLHHLHLQRLLEEQKLLQQQLGSAEHMALQR